MSILSGIRFDKTTGVPVAEDARGYLHVLSPIIGHNQTSERIGE